MIYPDLTFKPTLKVLSDDQVKQIHYATLELLERTGVQITHPQALALLDGAGAWCNRRSGSIPGMVG